MEYNGRISWTSMGERAVIAVKQAIKKVLRGGEKGAGEGIVLSAAMVEQAVQGCIRMLLAAVLSGAVVLGDKAPFGVALTAASGGGVLGGCAVLGACLGGLCQLEMTAGLRYASAAMLCYAAAFAFYDIKFLRRPWTMPLAAGLAIAFTGLVAHSRIPWTGEEQVEFVLELALTAGAVWCFRAGLRLPDRLSRREEVKPEQRGGMLVLLGAILAAMEPLGYLDLSLGRCLGGVCVLWAAYLGGSSTGAVWGLVLGTALDLTGEGPALRGVVWPLAALAAGVVGKKNRLTATLPWTVALCLCAPWVRDWDNALICAGEGVLAAALFLAMPRKWLPAGEWLVSRNGERCTDPGGVGAARERLSGAARAYQTLCHTLKDSLKTPDNDADVSLVFDRAASRVCKACANQSLCWQRDYSGTFNALNDATASMVERGRAEAGDFPLYFASRCVKMPSFLEAVNEELTALFYRRQYQARIRDSRAAVCRQYAQLSDLLYETARELGGELIPDPEYRRTLRRYAAQRGTKGEVFAYRDSRGLLRVRFEGADCARFAGEQELGQLSGLLRRPMRLERRGEDEVVLVEQEPFKAVAGVALRKKDGETVSGDAGTYFKRADGKVYLLLCDGMGSGEQASRESGLAIRLLEQFLQTGIPADHALLTLTSALALRGEETGGFTTVDLLEIDLFNGDGVLYKLGAAPTYVRQGDSIRRLAGSSLPAGLAEGTREAVDKFTLRLAPGDYVLMVSDGICGTGEDGWLLERLRAFTGDSPRKLAAQLITQSPQGATDDRTALAVRFEKRT